MTKSGFNVSLNVSLKHSKPACGGSKLFILLMSRVGLEPTTLWLKAHGFETSRNLKVRIYKTFVKDRIL
jgi:hypothetical protein